MRNLPFRKHPPTGEIHFAVSLPDTGVMPLSLNSGKVRAYSVDLAVLATGARPPPRIIREINLGIAIAAAILIAFIGLAMWMGD